MTTEQFTSAVTALDHDLLDRYFFTQQSLQKKRRLRAVIAQASLAACFAFVLIAGLLAGVFVSPSSSNTDFSDVLYYGTAPQAVLPHGQFVLFPILIAASVALCELLSSKAAKLKDLLVANATLFAAINLLTVLCVYLYAKASGTNLLGSIPILLTASGTGTAVTLSASMAIRLKTKVRWKKILLWLLVTAASFAVAVAAYRLFALVSTSTAIIA